MKVCSMCHREIPQDSKFCPYCMQRVEPAKNIKVPEKEKPVGRVAVIGLCSIFAALFIILIILLLWFMSKENINQGSYIGKTGTDITSSYRSALEETSSYLGVWDTIQDGSYIRVVVEIAEGKRVSGRAEVESLSSGRVSSVPFSGEVDEGERLSCAFSDDGWGAYGTLTLEFKDGILHVITVEEGYTEDYTGEWSIGNLNEWLEKSDE